MPQPPVLIDWQSVSVLLYKGLTPAQIADKIGINKRTLTWNIAHQACPDLKRYDLIPDEVWEKWQVDKPVDLIQSMSTPPPKSDTLALDWPTIADYLGTGLSIEETAIAAGVDRQGLADAYEAEHPAEFDTVDTWAAVLRAREYYQLMKSMAQKAKAGDIRNAILWARLRQDRWPKDAPAAPAMIRGV